MAKVLQNFLIGVGLDTEKYDDGAKKVESSLGRMRSLVGITGAAFVGAFAAVGGAAITAGQRVDDFTLKTEGLKTSRQYVYDYGRALAALGGDADDAVRAISSIEKAQADFNIKGLLGPLEDIALARGDINALSQTKDGKEFLRTLAPMVQNMNKEQQRMVQDALGLPDSVMRSLRLGVDGLDKAIARAHELAGNLDEATQASREFNKELAELNTRFEGIGNTLAEKVLPGFTGVLQSMGGFIDKNKDFISQGAKIAGENPEATALIAGGGAATAAGVAARGVGLQVLGKGLMRAGPYGMAAGTALLGVDAAKDMPWGDWWDQSVSSARDSWRRWTDWGDSPSSQEKTYGPEVPVVAPGSIVPITRAIAPLPLGQLNVHDRDPIYSGGEVSHSEAAQASPDVIMLRDQRQQAEKPAVTPKVTVQNKLDVNMMLDGRALETKIIDVTEQRERNMTDDIASTVDR